MSLKKWVIYLGTYNGDGKGDDNKQNENFVHESYLLVNFIAIMPQLHNHNMKIPNVNINLR